jgi:hypothetical protein
LIADFVPRLLDASEDHLPRSRLQDAGHDHIDVLSDQAARVVDHYHRTVIQVSDSLVILLALFKDEDFHYLAGQDNRLERIGQLIDVEHFDAPQMGDLIQIEIIGHDRRIELSGEFDLLEIDLPDLREVGLVNLDFQGVVLLNALQDIQPPAPAIPLRRV